MIHDLLVHAVEWSVRLVDALGYPGVVFLMFLESTFVPFPSELVMPQAGYLASPAFGRMNIYVAIAMGTLGSCLGAAFNYFLALKLGRPFLLKFGKYFLCPPHTFVKIETFFLKHGEIGTFTGRLIPGIRHLVSLPAGIARMSFVRLMLFTALGSGIWCSILAVIGYIAGKNMDLIKQYSGRCTVGAIAACAIMIAVYVWCHKRSESKGE
jgi:membrane protein DedA with SNARE-associated domain